MLNFELQIQQLIFFFISWIAFICYEISIANTTFRCFDLFTSALLNSEFQIQQFFFLSWTAFFENDVTNKHLNEYEKTFKSFLSFLSFLNYKLKIFFLSWTAFFENDIRKTTFKWIWKKHLNIFFPSCLFWITNSTNEYFLPFMNCFFPK